MLTALIALGILAAVIGLVLGYAAIRFHVDSDPVVDQIDALLPQTQCGQCTYAGCRPYAEAIAAGEADINQCPPGGTLCIQACPVDAIVGAAKQMHTVIRDECTGCNLCIAPCPVECIHIVPLQPDIGNWVWPKPADRAPGEIQHG